MQRIVRAWLRGSTAFGAAAAVVFTGARSSAQTAGFALDTFSPATRGSDWFASESLDLRGNRRWSTGIVGDFAFKPLVIYAPDGKTEQASVVSHQAFAHLGGAFTLVDRVRFAISLPIVFSQGGTGGQAQGATYSSNNDNTVGDIEFGADVRLVGSYRQPVTLSAGLSLFAPTGSRDAFTGDGAPRFVPRVNVAGDIGMFTYASGLGLVIRTQSDDFAGANLGSNVALSAAAGVRLADDRLTVGPELWTETVFSNADSFFAKRTTPLEVLAGAHYALEEGWRIGGGIGPGLTRAFGTPEFRVLLALERLEPLETRRPVERRRPELAPRDRDFDGVVDSEDACPYVYGIKTNDPKTNGCPPPVDTDGDGIDDTSDACPEVPGVKTDDPKTNGCPSDRDADGIIDRDDACPDEAGPKTDDPKTNGCPPPKDSDGDSILDADDACPHDPGPRSDDPSKNGCPLARVEAEQIKITEQVQFAYDSAKIVDASAPVLEAVLDVLQKHPEITRVSIEGHTDDKGTAEYNKRLSDQRAKAVMAWLVKHGIDKARLTAKGFGKDQPLDPGNTDAARAKNRRVELHIVEQKPPTGPTPGAKATPPATPVPPTTPTPPTPSTPTTPATPSP